MKALGGPADSEEIGRRKDDCGVLIASMMEAKLIMPANYPMSRF